MTTNDTKLGDCSGCTDPRSEGTHQEDTIQHPQSNDIMSWEKKLDEHFPEYFDGAYYEKEDTNLGDELKDFISTLLTSQKEALENRVDGLEKAIKEVLEYLPDSNKYNEWVWDECSGEEQDAVKEVRARTQALLK